MSDDVVGDNHPLVQWLDNRQGQIEALTRALAGLLQSIDPASPSAQQMLASLQEWRPTSANDPATTPAMLQGFDGVADQLRASLDRTPKQAH